MTESTKCNSTYYMSDPWYMVFCDRKLGHKGKHSFRWGVVDD